MAALLSKRIFAMSAQTVSSNGAVAQALKQVVQRVNDAAQRSRGIQQAS